MIFANATVRSPDARPASDQAVGVRDGVVAAIGDLASVRAALPGEEELDLGGAALLPGFSDAHGHLALLAEELGAVDLRGASSAREAAERVGRRAAELPAGEWIFGRGWDQNLFPGGEYPDRRALDEAAPRHRVVLERTDGHAAWLGSRALEAIHFGRSTPDPAGGRILRDAAGEPTGILVDRAMDAALDALPKPSAETREASLLDAARRCARAGLTCVHDAGIDLPTWQALQALDARGALPVRVYGMARAGARDFDELVNAGPAASAAGNLSLRAVKFFLDGALGSRGAALFEPYADEPGNRGLLVEDALLARLAEPLARRGFQLAVHAIGDRASALALDVFERSVGRDARPRLEHAQVLRPQDVTRLARLGAVASMQPSHATADMGWAEARLGPERVRGAYAWRSLRHAGAVLAFGSDFPIAPLNPLEGIYAACTRQDRQGRPPGGWEPQQRLTRAEAVAAYTAGPAWAAFEESVAGRIAVGCRADFTVFSRDPLEVPDDELLELRVAATVVGGRVVASDARTDTDGH